MVVVVVMVPRGKRSGGRTPQFFQGRRQIRPQRRRQVRGRWIEATSAHRIGEVAGTKHIEQTKARR